MSRGVGDHADQRAGLEIEPRAPPIAIDRLWSIYFGSGASLGRSDFLYFTAGPNGETDGILGRLSWVGTANPDPE